MHPFHTVCPDVCILFWIHFLIYEIAFLFHSHDSATRSSADATADILTKVDAASSNPPFTQDTETENDVSRESVEGGTFVTKKIILKLLLIWEYT